MQELPNLSFFGDTSSRDKAFMVAAGFAVSGHRIQEIEDQIGDIRERAGIRSEFHWSAYRGGRRAQGYEELADLAFELVGSRKAALHTLICPFDKFNHKSKPGDNRDTSINKMYYQMCLHRVARYYGTQCKIHIRLDQGNDSSDICNMRNQLCAHAYKTYQTKPNCIRSIEPVDSAKVGIVQMADLIAGAIAAQLNGVNSKSPKAALSNYVLRKSGRHSWAQNTPMSARFLTVWHHRV